jgi:TolB-like protein/cytochrome c-type biogenesis protein CcmH/NrfG
LALKDNQANLVPMSGFFDEVKRRKVYRVAVAYVIAAGGIIQLASAAFPAWELPNWSLRLVIVLLLIGFPIALILAWAFDVTSQGIKTTPAVTVPGSHLRRNVIMLIATGVIISAAAGFFLLPRAAARKIDKSIAVLPFENLSDDKENAYFADGIQDDVLTNLSKIGDLKVISRTSVMSYRGKTQNLREIGKALGVSNILEGSVRRSGNRVRVNVQLIDATTDEHLWASDYDRDLTDVFAIQTDLAQKIANELQAKLSPMEKARIENKPTQNSEGYLAFLQGHELQSSSYEDLAKLKQGEEAYARAITLDPNFALAFARYSQLESWIVHSFDASADRRAKSRTLAERAIQLQPGLPEAHLALGFVYYYCDNNFESAAREFEIAQRGLPNESEVYLAMGAIQRRQGKWNESNASLEKAVSLNPKDTWALQNLAINYEMLRNFDAANKTVDKMLVVNPNDLNALGYKAKLAIEEKGDFETAEKIVDKFKTIPQSPLIQSKIAGEYISMLILQRKFEEAERVAEKLPDGALNTYPGALCGKYNAIGMVKLALRNETGAREALLKAKAFAEDLVKQNPDIAQAHAQLAGVLARLGDKEAALATIKRAQELLPETKDAFGGPDITVAAAEVHALLGDADGAITLLDGLLQRPSTINVPVLKLDPLWDPIRKHPRFQALIDKYGAKA